MEPKEFVHSKGNLWRKCAVFYRARLRGFVCSFQNFVLSVFFIMRLGCT